MLWTLLIFIGCLTPGKELPHVDIAFIDKWTHFVLFGVFSFLWLCAYPNISKRLLFVLLFVSVGLGAFVELLQGFFTSLGRSAELMDAVADSIGALLGIIIFCFCRYLSEPDDNAAH